MSNLQVEKINHSTMQDHVYKRLCDLILDGSIAPGDVVTIQGLAEAFGVSAMPVREALKRLTAAGALNLISGRSVGVPNLDRSRLRDLHRVRLLLEPKVAAWAVDNVDDDFIARLDRAFMELEAAVATTDPARYVRANYHFHFTIYRQSYSDVAIAAIETFWLQVGPAIHIIRKAGRHNYSNVVHRAALNGIKAGNRDAVHQAIASDIEDGMTSLLQLVPG